ncbi:hypothetical protein [Syntrophotalea acetylenivorans]|uniref:hypothetical protein n=1 Tax=Syntrophotalea acetylenivorans TaxID=1842532 RepID=UPI000A764785|nr:hypothetical protein [Syntrophotalea acetylenivorans]
MSPVVLCFEQSDGLWLWLLVEQAGADLITALALGGERSSAGVPTAVFKVTPFGESHILIGFDDNCKKNVPT